MANFYVSSVKHAAITQWAATTAYSTGDYRRQLAPSVGNERVFKCTTAGTSGGSEPSWNLGAGATTSDGSVVWTECSGKESEQVAGNWWAAAMRINAVPQASLNDTLYLAHDHAETKSSSLSFTFDRRRIICVDSAGSLPPVTADLATTAEVLTTGTAPIIIATQTTYYRGVKFRAGSGSSAAYVQFGDNNRHSRNVLDNCLLELNTTSSTAAIYTGNGTTYTNEIRLLNTPMKFGAAGQGINLDMAHVEWLDTPNAVQGTAPTELFKQRGAGGLSGHVEVRGCDLSAVSSYLFGQAALSGAHRIVLANCKLHASVQMSSGVANSCSNGGWISIDNCDDDTNGRNYRFFEMHLQGNVEPEVGIYLTDGASDGVTSYAVKMTSVSTASIVSPLKGRKFAKRYSAAGYIPVTTTIEILINRSTALSNAEVWSEVEALTDPDAPISGVTSNRVANLLGTTSSANQSASTAAWTAPTRQNTHAYSSGDPINVSSNSGRVFFCTAGGTSSGSQPAGYATAVDGDTIADGSASFRAGFRQKLEVTFTPEMTGWVFGQVMLATASVSIWVDPKLTIA